MGQCPTPFCFLNSKSSWCKIERLEEVVFGLFINQKCVSGVTWIAPGALLFRITDWESWRKCFCWGNGSAIRVGIDQRSLRCQMSLSSCTIRMSTQCPKRYNDARRWENTLEIAGKIQSHWLCSRLLLVYVAIAFCYLKIAMCRQCAWPTRPLGTQISTQTSLVLSMKMATALVVN